MLILILGLLIVIC